MFNAQCAKSRGSFVVFPQDAVKCTPSLYPNADKVSGGTLINCLNGDAYIIQSCNGPVPQGARSNDYCNDVADPVFPFGVKVNCGAFKPGTNPFPFDVYRWQSV